jgi:hypothetical protein
VLCEMMAEPQRTLPCPEPLACTLNAAPTFCPTMRSALLLHLLSGFRGLAVLAVLGGVGGPSGSRDSFVAVSLSCSMGNATGRQAGCVLSHKHSVALEGGGYLTP